MNLSSDGEKTLKSIGLEHNSLIYLTKRCEGGGNVSNKADVNGALTRFRNRIEEYKDVMKEENANIRYYLGQSWHDTSDINYVIGVSVWIDDNLEKDWIDNIENAIKIINTITPGISIYPSICCKPEFSWSESVYCKSWICYEFQLYCYNRYLDWQWGFHSTPI